MELQAILCRPLFQHSFYLLGVFPSFKPDQKVVGKPQQFGFAGESRFHFVLKP